MGVSRSPRVLTYSHDGYGLGHLRRNLRVIGGLVDRRPDVAVLVITGCKCASEFSYPPGVSYLQLPSMTKVGPDHYVPDGVEMTGEDVIRLRGKVILDAVNRFRPNVMLVDRHPVGLGGELSGALGAARTQVPAARLVLGLRDILDSPVAVRSEWERKDHVRTIDRLYDSIMVYGSPAVYDPIEAYGLERRVAAKLEFTGYLAYEASLQPGSAIRRQLGLDAKDRLAVCTLGGGKDGAPIAAAFIDAVSRMRRDGWYGVLVTGPYMSERERAALAERAHDRVAVHRFVPDLPSHLAAADAVLCMGGYNTLCEALSVNAGVVVVPRVTPRVEQRIRAEAFAARGLVRVVHPERLSPGLIAAELECASAADSVSRSRAFEELGRLGVERAAAHLARMLDRRMTAGAAGSGLRA